MFTVRSVTKMFKPSNSFRKFSRNIAARTAAAKFTVDDSKWFIDFPHSGTHFPKEYYNGYLGDEEEPDIELFDVSMRDGIQTFDSVLPTNRKILMINQIIDKQDPVTMEIGSIVSQNVLPQFYDSLPLYSWATMEYPGKQFYLLTPNKKGVEIAIENDVNNLSFITSVSDAFQQKNIKKTLKQTKEELDKMYEIADNSSVIHSIKLYISCINECPIDGDIDKNYIINEIEEYFYKYPKVTNICISDTCGTLSYANFKYIIDRLSRRIPIHNLSLHLHYSNKDDITNILLYAYDKGITKFDVSDIENSGGCSVTIEKGKTNANLTYEDICDINF